MSLSDALRAAALERARRSGHTVGGLIIEPSGVIDLREMARSASREVDHSVKLPVIAGQCQPTGPEPATALAENPVQRRLRCPESEPADTAETNLDLRFDALELLFDEAERRSEFDTSIIGVTDDAAFDTTVSDDLARPVETCPRCGSFGQRDLLDRLSRTEYYSCDDCGHMWHQPGTD